MRRFEKSETRKNVSLFNQHGAEQLPLRLDIMRRAAVSVAVGSSARDSGHGAS